ncbi:MAG: ion transporter [Acidobacteria bacterium]|nr:ion transporter [Acidobacteriota bacterium]MCB9398316.1 ion transporter [Acidobacteriota bacterium]
MDLRPKQNPDHWCSKLYIIIFEHDTPAGKRFDEFLIALILLSVVTVVIGSVKSLRLTYGSLFFTLEWAFTLIFTVEYLLRLLCHGRPLRYMVSFFGWIDILAILPTYLDLVIPGAHYLIAIRILRVLRVFRILKLIHYIGAADLLMKAMASSARKIAVFLLAVLALVVVLGSLMYVLEGEKNGFTSIPVGIYWAIVTMTTVGYGDISPATPAGRFLAAMVMLLGYGIIAVPTGIVTVEMGELRRKESSLTMCQRCGEKRHLSQARYCQTCGERITTD